MTLELVEQGIRTSQSLAVKFQCKTTNASEFISSLLDL